MWIGKYMHIFGLCNGYYTPSLIMFLTLYINLWTSTVGS